MSTDVQFQEKVSENLLAFWEQRLRPALETMREIDQSPEIVENVIARVERYQEHLQEQVLHALKFLYRTAANAADEQGAFPSTHLYQFWNVIINRLLHTSIDIEEALEDLFRGILLPGEIGVFAVADKEEAQRQLDLLIPLLRKL